MSASGGRSGPPDLSTFVPATPPALDLDSGPQPPELGAVDGTREPYRAASPAFAVALMLVAGLFALLVLLPLALSHRIPSEDEEVAAGPSWFERLQALTQRDEAETPEAPDAGIPVAADADPVPAPAPAAPAAAPSASSAAAGPSANLVGLYCFDFLPGGKNAAAAATFDSLVWSKLNDGMRERIRARMEVCMPAEWDNSGYLKAMGCSKGQCGQNDVTVFIDRQGHAAVQMHEDGACNKAAEKEFSLPELPCSEG